MTRHMRVVRLPGSLDKPMIQISNSVLEDMGFEMGAKIEVHYQENLIVIRKITNYEPNNVQNQTNPVTNPAGPGAPSAADAGESHEHERERGPSRAKSVAETLREPTTPMRFVLRGQWSVVDA